MPKQTARARALPENKAEKELKKLVSECMALQEILQLNIDSLLESFEEVVENDNHSSQKAGITKRQDRNLSAS